MENLRIIKIAVENFKRLKAVTIEPRSKVIRVCGPNEAGKSSTLDAIWAAVGGKDASPDMPIRKGEKTASVTLDLGDLHVTRKWTEKGTYLEVTDSDGVPFASPQKVLDKLYGKFTFDPSAFLVEKDHRAALLQVVDINPDWPAFKTVSGMAVADTSDIVDPLRYIGDIRKDVYDKRRDLNRDVKAAEGRVAVARENIPAGMESEECPDIEALLYERKQARSKHVTVRDARQLIEHKRQMISSLAREQQVISEQIERLRSQYEEKKTAVVKLSSEMENTEKDIVSLMLPDLDALDARIAEATKLSAAAGLLANLKSAEGDLAAAAEKAKTVDDTLTAIDVFTQKLLKGVQMPVSGLGLIDEGITLDGIPFAQCSHAQRLKTSIAIGMAANPKLRILRVSDGEKFDAASWAIIETMAAENNFQIWIEQMDETGEVGVYIEAGEVVKNNYEKDPPGFPS